MTPRIHSFNPGHETAVLTGLQNYTPTANVRRMMQELALLPLWYAAPEDYVWVEDNSLAGFITSLPEAFRPWATPITRKELSSRHASLPILEAAPWGLSPHIIRQFEGLKEDCRLNLMIPVWKEDFFRLTGRQTAGECLERIQALLPEIAFPVAPRFCTTLREIERYMLLCNVPFVVKTPYSSSGRGLHWLDKPKLAEKDRTWMNGAFNKQGMVSIESVLDKQQDFAMEFYSDGQGEVRFEGLSCFRTEQRGAYLGNILRPQEDLKALLVHYIGEEKYSKTQEAVTEVIRSVFGNVYTGYIGVDMMIYSDRKGAMAIHPCLEINLRFTMGLLAHRLFDRYIHPASTGDLQLTYCNKSGEAYEYHCLMQEAHPIVMKEGKLSSGYLSLCPVTKKSAYRAYIVVV